MSPSQISLESAGACLTIASHSWSDSVHIDPPSSASPCLMHGTTYACSSTLAVLMAFTRLVKNVIR